MHFKKFIKPDCPYFGEQDFSRPDETITYTIISCKNENVTNEQGTKLKGVLYFKETNKRLILNKTNGNKIAELYGKDTDGWMGKRITLYYDANVRVAGKRVGGTRVKAPATDKMIIYPKCEQCMNDIRPAGRMSAEGTALYTRNKYGHALCAECAAKAKKDGESNADE